MGSVGRDLADKDSVEWVFVGQVLAEKGFVDMGLAGMGSADKVGMGQFDREIADVRTVGQVGTNSVDFVELVFAKEGFVGMAKTGFGIPSKVAK